MRRLSIVGAALALLLLVAGSVPARASDVSEAREAAEEAARELEEAEHRLGDLESEIAEVQHQHDVTEQELEELQGQVEEVAVNRYLASGSDTEVLLPDTDEETDDLLGNALARIITQGDADVIDEYAALREDLEASAADLEELLAEQRDAVEELEQRSEDLQAEVARLEELERERIEAERRRIEERRRALEAAQELADAAPDPTVPPPDAGGGGGGGAPPPPSGDFICPVPGSTFIDSWGAPRSGGRSHQGVDMMASEGTPIYASVSGTVEHRSVSLGGLSYYLYGDDGHTYFGTHLSGYAAGGRVVAGTVIGYVGSTGNAGTPHLHFEYHPHGGAPVNPYPLVAAAC